MKHAMFFAEINRYDLILDKKEVIISSDL